MRSFFESDYPHTGDRGSLAPVPSDYVDARVLAASTSKRHTIPAGVTHVLFSADGDFFARFGDGTITATVPAGDVTDGGASMLNPAARRIPAGVTHVALISAAARAVTMEWYGAPS